MRPNIVTLKLLLILKILTTTRFSKELHDKESRMSKTLTKYSSRNGETITDKYEQQSIVSFGKIAIAATTHTMQITN
jgi:hypothetical protein